MARLVITLDHLEQACLQMELNSIGSLFGGRTWEDELTQKHAMVWTLLINHLDGDSNHAMRKLLTLVCGTLIEARHGTLPVIAAHEHGFLTDGQVAGVNLVSLDSILEEVVAGMALHNEFWARLFRDALRQEKIAVREKFVVGAFALMMLRAQASEGLPVQEDSPFWVDPIELLPLPTPSMPPPVPAPPKAPEVAGAPVLEPVRDTHVSFDDIGGYEEIKSRLKYIAQMIKNPEVMASCGLVAPRGCLLVGPTGTGKTMLVHAVATELKGILPFYEVSQSRNSSAFINLSGQMIDSICDQVRTIGGGMIFIDEAEALLMARNGRLAHGEDIKVTAAINRNFQRPAVPDGLFFFLAANIEEILDDASIRTGRIDEIIRFVNPKAADRGGIFVAQMKSAQKRASNRTLFKIGSMKNLIAASEGFSCAEITEAVRRSLEPKVRAALGGQPFTPVVQDEMMFAIETIALERKKKAKPLIGFSF